MPRFTFPRGFYLGYPNTAAFYATVFGSVVTSTCIRFSLNPLLGTGRAPYVVYFLAVIVCSWLYGMRAGLLAGGLSLIPGMLLFNKPMGPHHEWLPTQIFDFVVVVVEWASIAILGEAQLGQRKSAEENAQTVREKSDALLASEEHLRLATEGAHIGTWRWDAATKGVTCSQQMHHLFGVTDEKAPTDVFVNALHPDDQVKLRESISSAIAADVEFDFDVRIVSPDNSIRWLVLRGHSYRSPTGELATIEGIAVDVSALKLAETQAEMRARRSDALNVISKAVRELKEPAVIQSIALEQIAATLDLDRALVILLDKKRDWVKFVSEWRRPDLASLLGEYRLADFDVDVDEIFSDAAPLVVPDVLDEARLSKKSGAMLQSLQIRALLDIPMSYSGQVDSALGAYMAEEPRNWTADEVSFVEAAASQLRAGIEANRLLSEAQSKAEREALINHIGSVIRTEIDPEAIQGKSVSILGSALGADRCYFAIYDLENGEVTIGSDYHAEHLPSVAGIHAFVNTKEMFDELYPISKTSVVIDRETAKLSEQTKRNMQSLQIRSRVSVAMADPQGMATLTAVMSDQPRAWTPEEIELIEKVAAQLRPTVEMARGRIREHKIATDLQSALQPALPSSIPGLCVGAHTQPALDEAEIGGDFYDVFSISDTETALVVGDVSGKGLAAAGQLATVRNSLRMCLYQTGDAADAINLLNSVVTGHGLLTGFVTLFVGIYDLRKGSLNYVSCGHEPGLIRRIDGTVDVLDEAGLPLGVSDEANYSSSEALLSPGDLLLICTDGITECGKARTNMLGSDGLVTIVRDIDPNNDPTGFCLNVLTKAKDFACGHLRDDVCILVARRPLA